jgi:L,D-peptidoglycan transpeptidase YkuD (ErfK/YbiS/YcfS/YnhG family)
MKCRHANGRIKATVTVVALSAAARRGWLYLGPLRFPCALGRGGSRVRKREGDGATPIGCWPIEEILFRSDRLARPRTMLPVQRIRRMDGWCDAPGDRNYNRPVRHPYPASAERLWREDGLYDVVVVLGHNQRPRLRGWGSAIFMHVARPGSLPTEGCIALERSHLLRVLERLGRGSAVQVLPDRCGHKKRPEFSLRA